MIVFQTALFTEAEFLIDHYRLKEIKAGNLPVRLFSLDARDVAVIVTGTGAVNACAGVASCLTFLNVSKGDVFVNFGMAGALWGKNFSEQLRPGDVVRCAKSTLGGEEKRPFYPDIIFGRAENLAEIITVKDPFSLPEETVPGQTVPRAVDMELYYAFSSANMFLGPESLSSFKVISDYAEETAKNGGKIDKAFSAKLIKEAAPVVVEEAEMIHADAQKALNNSGRALLGDLKELYEKVCERLSLSFSSRGILLRRITRDKLSGRSDREKLEAILAIPDESLPKDKKSRERILSTAFGAEWGWGTDD